MPIILRINERLNAESAFNLYLIKVKSNIHTELLYRLIIKSLCIAWYKLIPYFDDFYENTLFQGILVVDFMPVTNYYF